MSLIPAIKKDEALLEEMNQLLEDPTHFHLWWLGQSGFLLQWKGQRVLIDPYLSDALTKKYATTDKPHVRMSERVMDPALLRGISVLTSSHNHTDHLDAETVLPILKNNPGIRFLIPEANRDFVAERMGFAPDVPVGLRDGASVTFGDFTFFGIPARHNEIDRDPKGNPRYMGYVIAFGNQRIYHSGDTLWFDDMVTLLKPFEVNVALLPINGNDPARGVAGNLDAAEAVKLAKAIGAECLIPCHYDMFLFNTADVTKLAAEAEKEAQSYKILKLGERFSSDQVKPAT